MSMRLGLGIGLPCIGRAGGAGAAWPEILAATSWTTAHGPGAEYVTTREDGSDEFVEQWDDQTGNGHHLVQATAAEQPQFLADALNGRAVLDNLAVERGLVLDNVFGFDAFSWYFVGQPREFNPDGFVFNGTSSARYITFGRTALQFGHNQATDISLTTPATLDLSTYYVLSFVRTAAGACSAFINGVACTDNPQTLDASMQFAKLGERSASTGYGGSYAANLLETSAHDEATRQQIEKLLCNEFGLTWGAA